MDNFRINRHKHAKRSVDGFVSSTPSLNNDPKRGSTLRPIPYQSARNNNLDPSNRSMDGFKGQQSIDALPSLQSYPRTSRNSNGAESTQNRTPVAEKPRKKRKFKKVALISSLTLLSCLIFFGGFIFAKAWWSAHKVLKGGSDGAPALNSQVDPTLLKGEGDGRVNIMLLGIGGDNHPGADLTDSMLIASIDPISKEASLLSIPRDLWVKVPNYWAMKINAVYSTGKQKSLSINENDKNGAQKNGMDLLKNIVENDIGIPIHYYVLVDFTAFKDAVDAVGGVDINVPNALYDGEIAWENGNNPLIAPAGQQHFDGKKALLYARSRYTSSDFARGQRQRDLTVALKEKVLQLGTFSNPLAVTKLLDAVGNNVSTDLSLNEIMRIYEIGKDIPTTSIASLGFTDEPNVLVKTDNIDGQSVVVPRRGTYDYSEIQSYVRNSLRDGFLKSENATVAVLNGTGVAGLATKRTEELKSYGYNVISTGNAPKFDYATTELIDFTNGVKKYTKRYLEERLKVSAVTSSEGIDPAVYKADFVIIVGNNEATTTSN